MDCCVTTRKVSSCAGYGTGGPAYRAPLLSRMAVQALLGRELSADRQTVTVGTIPARSLVRAVRSDSISNLLGSMWNSQRLTPILRRNVSRVEPAKARDQRSRDRGDRSPLA